MVTLPCLQTLVWEMCFGRVPPWHGWLKVFQNISIPKEAELKIRCSTSSYDIHSILEVTHEFSHLATATQRHDILPPIQLMLSRCRHLTFGYPHPSDAVNAGDDSDDDEGYPETIHLDTSDDTLSLLSRLELNSDKRVTALSGASLLMTCFITHLPPDSPIQSLSLYRARPLDAAAFVRVMRTLPHLERIILFDIAPECQDEILDAIADP
ncbi:hypothetical protein BOTBODRAFT_358381 [Botryobasidium botryosum FD-172 SS1]|uniref:Uncharacterized protein n=1 Tax=Botryobasidium botryosum (strain FD-172 SS1) TaxID=930990 RepID=A0A067MER7_BOTB1|nr:hypothetical protein BOTBODRAFT_358381 [Botryobasidium botryosum FD-172 SS1]